MVESGAAGLCGHSLAKAHGRILAVFHNRRWDGDFLTIQRLCREGHFGRILQFESRFDRFRPKARPERWREQALPGAGILFDLGAHLLDQALLLFGRPRELFADVAFQKPDSVSNDYFHLILKYEKLRVILHSSSFSDHSPRFQVCGDQGSYLKFGFDPQEEALKKHVSPLCSTFGIEPEEFSGTLIKWSGDERHQSSLLTERGQYPQFYKNLYECLSTNDETKNPVPATEALEVIRMIELAMKSQTAGGFISVV